MKMQDLKAQAPPTKKKERIYDAPVQLAQDDMAALAEFLKEPTPTQTPVKPAPKAELKPSSVKQETFKPKEKAPESVAAIQSASEEQYDEYIVIPVAMKTKEQSRQQVTQAPQSRGWNPPNSKQNFTNPNTRKKEEKMIANALREQLPSPTRSQGSKNSIPCVDSSILTSEKVGQVDIDPIEQKWQEIIQQPLSASEHDDGAVSNHSVSCKEKYAAIHNFPCEDEKSWATEEEDQEPSEVLHIIKESSHENSPTKAGPQKMCSNISPFAQGIIKQLDEAFKNKDFTRSTDLLWDADCEGLGNQIDL